MVLEVVEVEVVELEAVVGAEVDGIIEGIDVGDVELLLDLALPRAFSTLDAATFLVVVVACSSSFLPLAFTAFLVVLDLAGVPVFLPSAALAAALVVTLPLPDVTELLLSTEMRLMSDLSDLVEESVSLLLLCLLPSST